MSSARINKTVRIINFARRLKFQTLHSSWIFLYLYHLASISISSVLIIYLFTYLSVNLSTEIDLRLCNGNNLFKQDTYFQTE